jgi:hypothetical protein
MGLKARCQARWQNHNSEGNLQLETEKLIFRGGFRLSMPLKAIHAVEAKDGWLTDHCPEGTAEFELGARAEKWAAKILHPAQRIDKLGVKEGLQVVLLGIKDKSFLNELKARTKYTSLTPKKDADLIFMAAHTSGDLKRLETLQDGIKANGAIWTIYPKGVQSITEAEVLAACKKAGLVDVKVVSFSPTHTALKMVIPKSRRAKNN